MPGDPGHTLAARTVGLGAAVEREPLGPLPTEGLGVHGALGAQFVVHGTGFARAAVRLFFAGSSRGVCRPVVEKYLLASVVLAREWAESARVELGHVDLGIAVQHPLGKVFAAAA